MTSAQDESAQAAAADLSVTVQTVSDSVTEVCIAGSLDLLTAPAMAAAIVRAMTGASSDASTGALQTPSTVLVDMQGVDFLGSAGLSVLVDSAKRADRDGVALALLATGHPVLHALQVTGLDTVLRVYPDREAALSALGDSAAS